MNRFPDIGERRRSTVAATLTCNPCAPAGVRGHKYFPERSSAARVAARWVATVGPVDHPVGEVEFEVNRFWQALVEKFDIFAIGGALTLGNLEIGAKDAAIAGIVRALL